MQTFRAGEGHVHRLSYSPDGRYLVVGHRAASELVWWDWAKGEPVRRFRSRDSLYGPGGAQRGQEDWSPEGRPIDVAFCFAPFRVATAWDWTGKEDGVCVYDADAQETLMLKTPYKTHTMRLALAADGSRLAAATYADMTGESSVEVWDVAATSSDPRAWERSQGSRKREIEMDSVSLTVDPVALAFDGRYLVTAGEGFLDRGPVVAVWDRHSPPVSAEPAEPDASLDWVPRHAATELTPGFDVRALALGNGKLAAAGGGLAVWDFAKAEWANAGGPLDIAAVAFDARGERVLVGRASGELQVWDAEGRGVVSSIAPGIGPIASVAFAPDGLTCAAGSDDGRIVVWDTEG